MVRGAVLEKNPSANRYLIEPVVRSYGALEILSALEAYVVHGTNAEKAGAASALYWVRSADNDEATREARQAVILAMLREFIATEDLNFQRRSLPSLALEKGSYRDEWGELVRQVIRIARASTDEYLRHRVEVQMGVDSDFRGGFMAIPDTQ